MEFLFVLIAGSIIMAAILSTTLRVMKGSSGLSHYATMKLQGERFLNYFEADLADANRIDFITPQSDELMAFDLYTDNTWVAGYSYGVDSSPPEHLPSTSTWYVMYRQPNGGGRYKIVDGLRAPPTKTAEGSSVSSFFFFSNKRNDYYDHTSANGQRKIEDGASKIMVTGIMQRGSDVDYPLTHEILSIRTIN